MTMKNYVRTVVIVCMIFLIGIIGFTVASELNFDTYSNNDVDVISLNDIKETAKKNWDNIQSMDNEVFEESFVILDNGNNMLYSSTSVTENTNLTVEEAIKCRYPYTYVIIDNRVVGCVIMLDSGEDAYIGIKNRMFLAIAILGLSILAGAFLLGIYINKNIIVPFRKMKHFAVRVSEGMFDEPLMIEKNNMFGVFSESFDIMREELARTKKREQELQRKEKELIASLSHDLKTPITGIKLSAELLKAKLEMNETDNLDRIADNIYNKADQMNLLVSDLFTYTLDDLNEFTVNCLDEESTVINDIIKRNDDKGRISQKDIPSVLINTDVKRLEQVIGNIIANSFKYADTEIDVNYKTIEGYLEMQIRDYGPGVPSEELPLITNKFYRAKEIANTKKEGSGLGLYISKTLMEKMNGEMMCKNEADGFSVILLIPLS